MRHSAGAPRLDYAVLLALLGDKEGTAVYEAFLRGDWRPRTNYHSSFYALARFARGHPEPCAGRARRFLSRALTAHPDPNVRAYAIRACSSYLGARGAGGKGFFLIELLIPLLDPRTDWRVRCAAGLELRRAFREAHPSWDYYHFWPPEKQRQAANALAHWWKRHEGHVRWQPLDPGYPAWCGYFVLER